MDLPPTISHQTIPLPIGTAALIIFRHRSDGLAVTVFSDVHTAITEARRLQENPLVDWVDIHIHRESPCE